MDLPLTPPPVPLPQRVAPTEFHKSRIIIIIAYIQLAGYASFVIKELFYNGFFDGGIFDVVESFLGIKILFLVPALVTVLTKNELAYKVARVFMIIEYIILIFIITLLFIIFGN